MCSSSDQPWFDLKSAKFHPSISKIILDVLLPGTDGRQDSATWIIDIPQIDASESAKGTTDPISFTWRDEIVEIVSQYIAPRKWDGDIRTHQDVPATHTCVREFAVKHSKSPDKLAAICVYLKSDGSLEALCLGLVVTGIQFTPFEHRTNGRMVRSFLVSSNLLEIAFMNVSQRKLLRGTFKLPIDPNLTGATLIARLEHLHGQVELYDASYPPSSSRSSLDNMPSYVIQY